MKQLCILLILPFLFTSCGQNETKKKELELREKELALKERELALKEKDSNNLKTTPVEVQKNISFKSYTPCTFSIHLPSTFIMKSMYNDKSLDYCDYSVITDDGFEIIQLHSLLNSRFEFSDIDELYQAALNNSKLSITYNSQKDNWFVISGTNKETGNIVYWKRVSGNNFISRPSY